MEQREEWAGWEHRAVKVLGEAVKRAREDRKLTQRALADLAVVDRGWLAKLESEDARPAELPKLGMILKLAVALDIPPISLLYPGLPDGLVEAIPGEETSALEAVQWFGGEKPLPSRRHPSIPRSKALLIGELSRELPEVRYNSRLLRARIDHERLKPYPPGATFGEIRSGAVQPMIPDPKTEKLIHGLEQTLQFYIEQSDELTARIRELGGVIDEDA